MLPNNQPEGKPQEPTGAVEQPTSPTSGTPAQPLPDYVTALQSQIAELTGLVKGVQKGTDKQIGQVRTDVKRILELKESGMSELQIQRELQLDALLSGQPTQNAPVQQPTGSGQPQNAGVDVEAVVKSLQFQPNDPALAALRIKYAASPQDLINAAADLRLSQLKTPNPTPGNLPSLQGNPDAAGGPNTQQMIDRLEELQISPTKNRAEIIRLTAELEARGWK